MVLLAKTELEQRLKRDLPRSEAVATRHSFAVKVVSSQQDTAGREVWLLGMSNLDKTGDDVGFPTQQKRVIEILDMGLELLKLAHELADAAINSIHLISDLMIGETQQSDARVCALSRCQYEVGF
jgi:hypothetical protein